MVSRRKRKGRQRYGSSSLASFSHSNLRERDQSKVGEKEKEEVLDNVKAKVETDVKVPKLPDMPPTEDSEPKAKEDGPVDEFEILAKRFEALKKR